MRRTLSTLMLIAVGCGEIKPSPPDAAMVDPALAVAPVVRVRQNNSTTVDVTVTRGSFEGPIDVAISGLPSDVTAMPIQIAAGATAGTVIVRASATAAHLGPRAIKLTAQVGAPLEVSLRLYVAGAPGSFDTSFSGDGITTVNSDTPNSTDDGRDIIVDGNGRIVAAGVIQDVMPNQGVAYRFTSDGANDATFGTGGRIKPPLESVEGVVARPGGGYAAVTYTNGVKVLRLDDTGAPVGAGVPSMTSASGRNIVGVADGFFVSGGSVIEKYTYDLAPAPGFGTAGRVSTATAVGLAVDSQGRLLGVSGGTTEFRVGRLLATGEPDTTFPVTFLLPAGFNRATGRQVVIDGEDGGYLCGEMMPTGGTIYTQLPVLLRFRADGTINTSFGTNGLVQLLGPDAGTCGNAVRLADGRVLLVASRSIPGPSFRSELWMRNPDGSFDTSFGTNGVVLPPHDRINNVVVDEGGRAVLVGGVLTAPLSRLYVARIWL